MRSAHSEAPSGDAAHGRDRRSRWGGEEHDRRARGRTARLSLPGYGRDVPRGRTRGDASRDRSRRWPAPDAAGAGDPRRDWPTHGPRWARVHGAARRRGCHLGDPRARDRPHRLAGRAGPLRPRRSRRATARDGIAGPHRDGRPRHRFRRVARCRAEGLPHRVGRGARAPARGGACGARREAIAE